MFIPRIQITLNNETNEIWPSDDWSRQEIMRILGNSQIEFDYAQTTMGMPALKFRNAKDYRRVLSIIDEKYRLDTKN